MDPGRSIKRNLVVQRWGTPQMTIGNVNEPRELEEHGVTFNEKWIYRGPRNDLGAARERWVYWNRYDFVGAFLVLADGAVVQEDPAAFLAGIADRLYRPASATTDDR
jgi:hypothetical protein